MKGLLTPKEVGELLQIPVTTLYGWRYAGRGPRALRVGRHLRYRRDDVEEWLDEVDRDRPRRKNGLGE
jgi:excisionase family DNA binding protein